MSRRLTSRSLLATLLIFVAGIITIGILYAQLFITTFPIQNDAMSPALAQGTTAIVNSRTYAGTSPKRGDIVLVTSVSSSQTLARIVGLPSETITFAEQVRINDSPLEEPYVSGELISADTISLNTQTYLLLTDKRDGTTPLLVTKDEFVGPALWVTGGQLPLATVKHHLYQ